MKKASLNHGTATDIFTGMDSVTVERVRARARELALIAGHPTGHVTPADFEQAKRELTGGPEQDAKDRLTGFDVKETRYYESDTAFLRRVLGNRKGRGAADGHRRRGVDRLG